MIDFQRDFLLPDGFGASLGNNTEYLQKAVKPTQRVLQECRSYGLLIIHTREGHKPDLSDCPESKRQRGNLKKKIGDVGPMGRILIRGEYGHGIIDDLAPLPKELVIDKSGKGAFYATVLDEQLKERNIKYLVIVGVTTEVCVESTVREANDRAYEVLVLDNCVASYNQDFHEDTLRKISSQNGIFGWIGNSEDFLKSLR